MIPRFIAFAKSSFLYPLSPQRGGETKLLATSISHKAKYGGRELNTLTFGSGNRGQGRHKPGGAHRRESAYLARKPGSKKEAVKKAEVQRWTFNRLWQVILARQACYQPEATRVD